jgi:hypothetical protein
VSIKIPRRSNEWLHITPHPWWMVQKALDGSGDRLRAREGPVRSGKRDELERLSGQRIYPVIESEDGRVRQRVRSCRLPGEGEAGRHCVSPP